MKDALIVEILAPLYEFYRTLGDTESRRMERIRLKQAIDSVKKDLETVIGDSLDPD
jgi:hypothetical protein